MRIQLRERIGDEETAARIEHKTLKQVNIEEKAESYRQSLTMAAYVVVIVVVAVVVIIDFIDVVDDGGAGCG